MFERNKGIDIVQEIGGITTVEAADEVFAARMDSTHLARIRRIDHPEVIIKIANAIVVCDPESIYVNTGTDADRDFIRDLAIRKGEEAILSMPDHTIHFDLKEEQGRIIDRTYYIANDDELVNSLAKRMDRETALREISSKMAGIMRGMTLIIGFYMRGPVGAPVANPALELTSSAYVAHSAELLYRNAYEGFDAEVARLNHFYANIHSEGTNRAEDLPHARVLMDRSHRTTYSFFCTYAGNTLLLKKGNHRFSVDRSIYERRGTELAEHMFITGIEGPGGRVTWFTGAAPSGCGKTTTAMAGTYFVGDDLAQMWIAEDGTVRSVNPERGIFGIIEDVNWDGDPMLMEVLRNPGTEVIWSNVLIDPDGVPRWTGSGEPVPERGRNFQGEWHRGMTDEKGNPIPISHPNARCTLRSTALRNYADAAEAPEGVETRVITYSGRDADTMPPVWVARSAAEGVAIGACIVSAATATEVGATGVKRAPWANAPFIPGALADYLDAQLRFFENDRLDPARRPILAGLNYFLTDCARGGDKTCLLGEKRDVKVWMAWLERRAHGDVDAHHSPIGDLPRFADLEALFAEVIDKVYPEPLYLKQFSLYADNIIARIDLQIDAYGKEAGIPDKLFAVLRKQREGLSALRDRFGPVITPDQLDAARA